jgi:hypothetical protein
VFLASLALLCAGCSKDKSPPPQAEAAPPPAPLPNSNVFSSDIRALQKAKDVQNVVNDQKQKTDEQLKDAGG